MKSEIVKKLKGTTISTTIGQIMLKDTCKIEQTQFDSVYFYTNLENMLCKVYDLEKQISIYRYMQEKINYENNSLSMLAPCISVDQFKRKKNYGYIILGRILKQSSIRQKTLKNQQLLRLCEHLLQLIIELKKNHQIILNLKPQHIYQGLENVFYIIEPIYLASQCTMSDLSNSNPFLVDKMQSQYKYYSPELLDTYSNIFIDYRSDLFVVGCILYELATSHYPFESRFAAISLSKNERNLQNIPKVLEKIINLMLQPYKKRPQPQQLLQMLKKSSQKLICEQKQLEKKQEEYPDTSQSYIKWNPISMLAKMLNNGTTEGFFLNYVENTPNQPNQRYLDELINKLYKKKENLQKLRSIINKHISTEKHSNVLIKSIIMIGQLFRKGPSQIFNVNWSENFNFIKAQAQKNNNSILLELTNQIIKKQKLHLSLPKVFSGNFHLEQINKFNSISIDKLKQLCDYLVDLVKSFGVIIATKQDDELVNYTINFYCDEIYDLLSILILMIISIRKDNELQLRKDQIEKLKPLEDILNRILKKVSSLSNYISAHAIYSVQIDYSYYREQLFLKTNPHYTTLQHFYRSSNYYKGLTLPKNFKKIYTQNGGIENLFTESKKQIQSPMQSPSKKYFDSDDKSDEQISVEIKKIKSDDPFKHFPPKEQNKNKKLQNIDNIFFGDMKTPGSKDNMKNSSILPSVNFNQFPFFEKQMNQNNNNVQKETQKKNVNNNNNDAFKIFANLQFNGKQQKHIVKKPVTNHLNKSQIGNSSTVCPKNQKVVQKKQELSILQTIDKIIESGSKKAEPKNKPPINNFDIFDAFINKQQVPSNKINPIKSAAELPKQKKEDNFFVITQKQQQQQQKKPKYTNLFGNENLMSFQQKLIQQTPPLLKQIQEGLRLNQLKQLLKKNVSIIIQFNKLKFGKILGKGSAGQVFLGTYQNQQIAIKKVKTAENPNALKQFERQLVTYIKIKKNPYLVCLIGLSKQKISGDYYLLTQFCSGGSLFDLLHKKAKQIMLSWKQRHTLALEIAKGMKFLHSMKPVIIHRDLKSLNVFIAVQNGQFKAKVADFGLSRSPQAQFMTSALGTLHWMAPQLLQNKQYSYKVDVYSYGILLWQICSRKTPYNQFSNPMAIMRYVVLDKGRPKIEDINNDCPKQMISLMKDCWDCDSGKRPQFSTIITTLENMII